MAIIVSACLLGENCKYSGGNNKNEKLLEFLKDKEVISVCPEVFGGLPTPRTPSERVGKKVLMSDGTDVTREFTKGAQASLDKALSAVARGSETGAATSDSANTAAHTIDFAILKAKSPSCGVGTIYDGTFTHTPTNGNGVFADLLIQNNIKVFTEETFAEALK